MQKIEFKKKVMENRDEKHEEMLGTIQKLLRLPLVKWRTARKPREKIIQRIPGNVRLLREEAAARSTNKFKRRVLKKQARKARAEHFVKCCLKKEQSTKSAAVRIVCQRGLHGRQRRMAKRAAEALRRGVH